MLNINYTPTASGFIFNSQLTLSQQATSYDLQSGNFQGSFVAVRSVEIISVKNVAPVDLYIGGRQITIPPFGYAVLNIDAADQLLTIKGYGTIAINFFDHNRPETLLNFYKTTSNINSAEYAQYDIYLTKAAASPIITYGASTTLPGAAGLDINTPIKIANLNTNRIKTILGNNFVELTFPIYCFYGFASTEVVIPFQGGQFMLNSPLTISEYWITFDRSQITSGTIAASMTNVFYGSIIKEFYSAV